VSSDEQTLLIAGLGYLIAVAVWALSLHARARTLLKTVGERIDPDLWQSLGAPDSIKAAMQDPERRWRRFVRSGEYLRRCDAETCELIDDYRRRTKFMLFVSAVAGVMLVIRFRDLIKPAFL